MWVPMVRCDLPRAVANSLWVASRRPVWRWASRQRYAKSLNAPSDSNVNALWKRFPAANQPVGSFKRSFPLSKETFLSLIGVPLGISDTLSILFSRRVLRCRIDRCPGISKHESTGHQPTPFLHSPLQGSQLAFGKIGWSRLFTPF